MLIVSDSKIVIHEQAVCLICNNDIVNNSGMGWLNLLSKSTFDGKPNWLENLHSNVFWTFCWNCSQNSMTWELYKLLREVVFGLALPLRKNLSALGFYETWHINFIAMLYQMIVFMRLVSHELLGQQKMYIFFVT